MSRYAHRAADLEQLLPAVRERVRLLLERLRAAGYDPVPWETLRTPARARELAANGRGIEDSMHLYGAAADIICEAHGWSCGERGCGFYDDLGAYAEAIGLTWGGRWRRVDKPHVQALKVRDQAAFRRVPEGERDDWVRARLPRLRGL